jgi:hypothetical protein
MLDDVKRVEKNPHRMRRIREPSVGEGVPGQQVAELVMNLRLGHGEPRQEGQTRKYRYNSYRQYGTPSLLRETRKFLLDPSQNWLSQSWLGPHEEQANAGNNPI